MSGRCLLIYSDDVDVLDFKSITKDDAANATWVSVETGIFFKIVEPHSPKLTDFVTSDQPLKKKRCVPIDTNFDLQNGISDGCEERKTLSTMMIVCTLKET